MSNPNYEYVCIECGVREIHNRRFFPLDELLRIFVLPLPGAANNLRDYLRAALPAFRVGALFGGQVLGTEVLTRQADSQKDFSAAPDDMTPVALSMTGVLHTIERQLDLPEGTLAALVAAVPPAMGFNSLLQDLEHSARLDGTEDPLLHAYRALERALTPFLNSALGNADTRQTECAALLDALRQLVDADPSVRFSDDGTDLVFLPDKAHVVYAAWTYSPDPLSHVNAPAALVVYDADDHNRPVRSCSQSCCPHCHKPLPRSFGSYRQVTVGVLGGQSTGKTTYLAALTDCLNWDPIMNDLPVSVACGDEQDPQWKRFRAVPQGALEEDASAAGPLWFYRNGYRARKTELTKTDAASLTFLVTPRGGEPIIYVLADIAGEAFTGEREGTASQAAEEQKALLRNCDALFMVFSCDPKDLRVEATRYIEWMRGFENESLIGQGVPAALLLTKADELFTDGQRSRVQQDLVTSLRLLERTAPVVNRRYNVEPMSALCRLSFRCADQLAPGLMTSLQNMLCAAAGGELSRVEMAAFSVCSGTAGYVEFGTDSEPDISAQRAARYRAARESRTGITAPLLWLLALHGLLPAGRGQSALLQYDDQTQQALDRQLREELRFPNAT